AQLADGVWDHSCARCGGTLAWQPSGEGVVNPCNQYALSKHAQEQIAIQLGKRYDIPSVVMRYSIVQGPRQSFYNAYSGAMRIFTLCLLADRAPLVFEDGLQIRDYVNIEDVVAANLLVLERSEADGLVFNVGGDRAWTVLDFYGAMQRIVGKEIPPDVSGHYRYGDTRHIFSDIGRLRALGWRPRRGVEDSIRDYWGYLTGQTACADALEHAQQQMKTLKVIRRRRGMS
ncbi:MAG: NAD-dependent epimerase/dehydratase family protein, partial [Desulfobacterales bacterium]|nr:NAD-dependent epimerase/dehydratase family protein [Desulfobacterales bacterium]